MTDFFANCVTATTDNCNSTDYNANYFDGWSIGAYLSLNTWTDALQVDLQLGVCLLSNLGCFGIDSSDVTSTSTVENTFNGMFFPQ